MEEETYEYIVPLVIILIVSFIVICYYLKPTTRKLNNKQSKFKLTLEDMDDILEQHDIHYFLACGTSLGCHREKQFIEHDHDIDLGIFEDISFQKIIDAVNTSDKFILHRRLPIDNIQKEGITELTFIHTETHIPLDIFKYYKKGDKYMMMAYFNKCDSKPRNRCEWLDPINLIQMEFMDRTYNVPDMEFIKSRYGSDWNIPKVESYYDQGSIIN
jgi:hypothetical protein